jgi:hypothetical protein
MKRLATGFALFALTACSETTIPVEFRNVQVSFATQSPSVPLALNMAPAEPQLAALDDTLISGSDTLILESIEIVLREIELERIDGNCDDNLDDDACQEFEAGPYLVSLPIGTGVEREFELDVPPGTYSEIEFDIHKVEDDPADVIFLQSHPAFAGLSIRATGAFNGQSFLFESELGVEQELDLIPSLVVEEGSGSINITVLVEVDSWFRDLDGNLLDPETANKGGDNESLVNDNIKDSFEAFEDDDRDGDP